MDILKIEAIINRLPICDGGKRGVAELVSELIGQPVRRKIIFQVGKLYREKYALTDHKYICVAMTPGYNLILLGEGAQVYGQTRSSLEQLSDDLEDKFVPVTEDVVLTGA